MLPVCVSHTQQVTGGDNSKESERAHIRTTLCFKKPSCCQGCYELVPVIIPVDATRMSEMSYTPAYQTYGGLDGYK